MIDYRRREIITVRGQSYVRIIQNIEPHPPLRPASVSFPRNKGGEGGGGSIFWKTRDIGLAFYSNNLSTTTYQQNLEMQPINHRNFKIIYAKICQNVMSLRKFWRKRKNENFLLGDIGHVVLRVYRVPGFLSSRPNWLPLTRKRVLPPGLWTRIHFFRIRIQHLRMDTNPDPDPGL
jgi:hypothetical protein